MQYKDAINRCCPFHNFKEFKVLLLGFHSSSNSWLFIVWLLDQQHDISGELVRNADSLAFLRPESESSVQQDPQGINIHIKVYRHLSK